MDQPKKIVLTTDFSETSRAAIGPAVTFARAFGATLLLVHVAEPVPVVLGYPGLDMVALDEHHRVAAREELRRFAEERLPKEIETERVILIGVPHAEIVRFAEERHADLIVMATHGRNFFSHAFLGSTAERVLRRAPCPVMVVRDPGAPKT